VGCALITAHAAAGAAAGGGILPQPTDVLKPSLINKPCNTATLITKRWAAAGAAGAAAFVSGDAAGAGPSSSINGTGAAAGVAAPGGAADTLAVLRAENVALRTRLAAVMAAAVPDELLGAALSDGLRLAGDGDSDGDSSSSSGGDAKDEGAEGALKDGPSGVVMAGKRTKGAAPASAAARIDAAYYESYSYFDIHREMLGDKVRMQLGLVGTWE